MSDPKGQYQHGDYVVLLSEGIITRISGYEWAERYSTDEPQKLIGYKLACETSAPADGIRRATAEEMLRVISNTVQQ